MKKTKLFLACCFLFSFSLSLQSQTLAFPGAMGFGKFAPGARGNATQSVYIVTNLNDAGTGSFRDAVSQPGRIVTFRVGGIVHLVSDIGVANNITIAGQTAPGDGIVLVGKRVTFSNAYNTICRNLRIRLGATGNSGKDASGIANGKKMMLDHMSFTWGMDEVFSINWDGKNYSCDSITIQNSIIGQGLHRENHSAGGLIQTPDGGKISLLQNLYISNKTRNPKVKGINEFVNNVVYNYGNGNRLDTNLNYGWSGEGYIMGGSAGVSEVNIINNYFVGGPLTPPADNTPFSRGTGSFFLYASGNYFDNNKNGVLDGTYVPEDGVGYPGIDPASFQAIPYGYPDASPPMTAAQAYQRVIDSAGPVFPRRDQLDQFLINEVASKGTQGFYVYRETNLPLSNGGVGDVFGAPFPPDTDNDGMPDAWEDANGLNKNSAADALTYSLSYPQYLNLEVYINNLVNTVSPTFIHPPTSLLPTGITYETPTPNSTVTLNWTDNSANENAFLIERSGNGTNFTQIGTTATNIVTYSDPALTPNTSYYYRVRSANTTDTSIYVTATIVTPPPASQPAIPALSSPVNGDNYVSLTTGSIPLKWTGSTNTTNFEVYIGSSATTLSKIADVAYSAAPSYTVTGLAENTTYFWRIDADNALGITPSAVWNFKTLKKDVVAHWQLNETSGLIAYDRTLYGNHGTLTNMSNAIWFPAAKIAGGLGFGVPGSTGAIAVPNDESILFNYSPFSISMWVKIPSNTYQFATSKDCYLLHKGSFENVAAYTGKWYGLQLKDNNLTFAIDDGRTKVNKDIVVGSGTYNIYTNTWKHIVAVKDNASSTIKVYIDAVMAGSASTTAVTLNIGQTDKNLLIGNSAENKPYRDSMDDVRFYNYALTQTEITNIFTGTDSITGVIPVRIVSFTAQKQGRTVLLQWNSSYELNSHHFEIERSSNGIDFVSIGNIPSTGYSGSGQSYSLKDLHPFSTTNYYRLVQYDLDGRKTYFNTIVVSFKEISKYFELSIYPNPSGTKQVAYLQLSSKLDDSYNITILNASGQFINRQKITAIANSNGIYHLLLPSKISSGVYFINVKSDILKEEKTIQLILQ
jgi:hypothetical protein